MSVVICNSEGLPSTHPITLFDLSAASASGGEIGCRLMQHEQHQDGCARIGLPCDHAVRVRTYNRQKKLTVLEVRSRVYFKSAIVHSQSYKLSI